ncbi:MAG TPA: HlyD family efflux transporter periplasmic adaptor subunit [Cellvibrionaceae bacterium]|nr:HlyD family efflux transporter periplasmic adaptor subunit [Cellvibrionaceae bacterium]HMY39410.1 HlyD family efflux transporter periplasmic adaptor subunit [Marinagarivorans sp.]
MGQALFRAEVFSAPPLNWGTTRLGAPLPWQLVIGACALIIAASIVLLLRVEYTNKAKVAGFLSPSQGVINLWSPSGGVIRELYVKEGDTVEKGQTLCLISSATNTATGNTQAQILEQLTNKKHSLEESLNRQDTIADLERTKLTSQSEKLNADWAQNRAEFNLAERKIQSLQLIGDKYQRLYQQQFVSELELEQARQRILEAQLHLHNLTQNAHFLQHEISRMAQEHALLAASSQERKNALQRDINQLQQEILQQQHNSAHVVVAPDAGIVGTVAVHPSQMINANQSLFTLLPAHSPLQAVLIVPSRAAGFIQTGQQVVMRYGAFPYQKFGTQQGKIISIDHAITQQGDANVPIAIREPSYLVAVELNAQAIHTYGDTTALKAGMLLDADIYLDHRSLADWLLDPIKSISRK